MTRATPSFRCRWRRLIACAWLLPLFGALPSAQAATGLAFISSPFSWVGAGETVSVGPEDGFAFTAGASSNQVSFAIDDFHSNPDPWATRWWYLDLAAPLNQAPTVGRYTDATRFPFQTQESPGLSFIGNGRGNNTLTGAFTVLEADYADDGTVLSFAADFLQYDGGSINAWIKGAIRLNSDLPISLTPEPIVLDPLDDPGVSPDPDPIPDPLVSEPVSIEDVFIPSPIVFFPEPSIEEPPIVAPGLDGLLIDPPIVLSPFPEGENGEPVYWYSSGSSMVTAPPLEYISIATPGPLPIAGALVGWHRARCLRRRCRQGRQTPRHP